MGTTSICCTREPVCSNGDEHLLGSDGSRRSRRRNGPRARYPLFYAICA